MTPSIVDDTCLVVFWQSYLVLHRASFWTVQCTTYWSKYIVRGSLFTGFVYKVSLLLCILLPDRIVPPSR